MFKKHLLFIILLFLLIISPLSCAFASTILINHDLFLQDDGSLHIKETVHYPKLNHYNNVSIDIPVNGTQQLQNLKISTPGLYNKYTVTDLGDRKQITVYLYIDQQNTINFSGSEVNVTYEYDVSPVIKFYNDIAELQYTIIGDDSVYVDQVNTNIHLKSGEGVKYWLVPEYYVANSSWQSNDLQLISINLPPGKSYQIRMFIPQNQFPTKPKNGLVMNTSGAVEIEKLQNDVLNQLKFKTNLNSTVAVLLILACFIPLLIYLRFGRNPKIEYNAIYERDTPTNDPPAVINAISGKVFGKQVGEPDMDGFRATIMDLIYRKYLIISKCPTYDKNNSNHCLVIRINKNKDLTKLENFETDVLDFLRYFEDKDGLISMDKIKKDLKWADSSLKYDESYSLWKSHIKQLLNDEVMEQVFKKRGDTYLKIFASFGLIVGALTFFVASFNPLPTINYAFISAIVLSLVSAASISMPEKIAGHWTTYGEEYDAEWRNFAHYIQDFSMIKNYTPESIETWDKYLVYATALGIADKVVKSMEISFPGDVLAGSDIYRMHK